MSEKHEQVESPAKASSSVTFLVRIMYAQNSTTQGMVQWLDEDKSVYFRSLLELVSLLTEALKSKGRLTDLRSWDKSRRTKLSHRAEGQ